MRVGLVERPPWVVLAGPEPGGVEVALVRALAIELDARIEWVTPAEGDVLEALKRRELALVVGGLTEANPWSAHLAFTRPYHQEWMVVAARKPAPLASIDGQAVLVNMGTVEPALVEAQGGVPVPAESDLSAWLEAKPEWRLDAGETAVLTLAREGHVFAVPQGENAFLIRVDRFLRRHAGGAEAALRELAAR